METLSTEFFFISGGIMKMPSLQGGEHGRRIAADTYCQQVERVNEASHRKCSALIKRTRFYSPAMQCKDTICKRDTSERIYRFDGEFFDILHCHQM